MELITPNIGLIFWMTVVFLLLFFALKKFAWPTILNTLKERETSISNALNAADKAREEIKNLQVDNEKLLREARAQSEDILRRAADLRKEMIGKAQNEAQLEYERIIERAKQSIENEKKAAIAELKNDVAKLAIDISQRILEEELKEKSLHERMIEKTIKNLDLPKE